MRELLPYPPSKLSPQRKLLKPHKKNKKKWEYGLHRWRPKTTLNKASNKVYTKYHANFIRK